MSTNPQSPPHVFPCGQPGQPACPPTNAVVPAGAQLGTDASGALHIHKEGFWQRLEESVGNAIGEAKFGE